MRSLLARRQTSRRRGFVAAWLVIAALAAGTWWAYVEAKARREHARAESPSGAFEPLRDEWKVLAEAWRAQQRAAASLSDTGNYWTARDDDAFRILQSVAANLEHLRRLEARQERTAWVVERLSGDRREWDALVVGTKQLLPEPRSR